MSQETTANFTFKKLKDIIIVYLTGALDNKKSREVEEDFEEMITQYPDKNLLINMKELRYMSSSGLRVLVSLRSALLEAGLDLKLCNMGRNVREVFELTKVMPFFKVYEDEISALDDDDSDLDIDLDNDIENENDLESEKEEY